MKLLVALLAVFLTYHTWNIAKGYWQEKEKPAGIFLVLLAALFPILTVVYFLQE